MSTPRRQFTEPFNPAIPPLFLAGGILHSFSKLGARIAFLVALPQDQVRLQSWQGLWQTARRELAEVCFDNRRYATVSELSQLYWLKQAGHFRWHISKADEDYLEFMLVDVAHRIKLRQQHRASHQKNREEVVLPLRRKLGLTGKKRKQDENWQQP